MRPGRDVAVAEAIAKLEAERHRPDSHGGCTCGFVAYSVEHVVVMSLREAIRRG